MVSNRDIEKKDADSNKRICQTCRKKNSLKAEFCIECGNKLPKFIIPFSDTVLIEDSKLKVANENPTPYFAAIEKKQVESSEKKEIQKTDSIIKTITDSDGKDIKKRYSSSDNQICQTCGNKNPFKAKFCITCGKELHKNIMPFSNSNSTKKDRIQEKTQIPKNGVSYSEIDSKKAVKEEELSNPVETNPLDAIKKANELLKIGAISEEEFKTIKAKYIEKI